MTLDAVKPELMQETLVDLISEQVFLNPEHEIIKKYLEIGSWKKAGIDTQIGKRSVMKVFEFHYTHCSLLEDYAHEIVKKYLKYNSWKKIGIHHSQTGKREIRKVLMYHFTHCLNILESNTNVPQKVLWKCPACNKEMMLTHIQAKQRKYCSFECFNSTPRKRKPTSDKRAFRMSPEWRRIRKKRILDFGDICPVTLKKERIDLHHIDSDWSNNEPENLIPLQRELHRLVTARANYDDFLEARDRAIFSSITKAWKN